ncbi:hypothetical protein M408DRAFT_67860 [Serendipita vermifera MAFF 305830]|uniref:RING-type domain-containing protein n=1 Tax=Serendipita vermifera MAFF 305830 TaxID=933852 RepID=A0A0C3AYC9_SERVB|nr:hypothetical protein M408DRAFT_67860 [Serendipita vermifera MAFF 305830]
MAPIGSDVRLVQIIALALEHKRNEAISSTRIQLQNTPTPGPLPSGPDNRARSGHPDDSGHTGFTKDLVDLLKCEICLNLLAEPITTPCQHTFCLTCLQRSLDHTPNCPLCRHHFANISIFNLYQPSNIISSILSTITPSSQAATPTQDPDHALDTPIFVCQLSFPDMPTILHIFEPRYRLMLRRALNSENRQFGMIMYPAHDGVTINYGTMLRIQSVKILADGRSVIETWGAHRFRIVNRGERDGYVVGQTERIDDLPEAVERELERNATLYIPPRTPPVQPLQGPILGHSPASSPPALGSVSPPVFQLQPRSNSPAPSLASLNSVSTLSSTHSVPNSSGPGTSASQSSPRQPSPPSQSLRRIRSGSSRGSQGSLTAGNSTHHHASTTTVPPRVAVTTLPGYDYPSEMSTDELVATCHAFIQRLRRGSSQIVIQRLNNVGPVPEDKALLSFWIAQLLPIDEAEKSKLLPIRSPRLRLRLVVHWIDQFNAAWWFSGQGCVVV